MSKLSLSLVDVQVTAPLMRDRLGIPIVERYDDTASDASHEELDVHVGGRRALSATWQLTGPSCASPEGGGAGGSLPSPRGWHSSQQHEHHHCLSAARPPQHQPLHPAAHCPLSPVAAGRLASVDVRKSLPEGSASLCTFRGGRRSLRSSGGQELSHPPPSPRVREAGKKGRQLRTSDGWILLAARRLAASLSRSVRRRQVALSWRIQRTVQHGLGRLERVQRCWRREASRLVEEYAQNVVACAAPWMVLGMAMVHRLQLPSKLQLEGVEARLRLLEDRLSTRRHQLDAASSPKPAQESAVRIAQGAARKVKDMSARGAALEDQVARVLASMQELPPKKAKAIMDKLAARTCRLEERVCRCSDLCSEVARSGDEARQKADRVGLKMDQFEEFFNKKLNRLQDRQDLIDRKQTLHLELSMQTTNQLITSVSDLRGDFMRHAQHSDHAISLKVHNTQQTLEAGHTRQKANASVPTSMFADAFSIVDLEQACSDLPSPSWCETAAVQGPSARRLATPGDSQECICAGSAPQSCVDADCEEHSELPHLPAASGPMVHETLFLEGRTGTEERMNQAPKSASSILLHDSCVAVPITVMSGEHVVPRVAPVTTLEEGRALWTSSIDLDPGLQPLAAAETRVALYGVMSTPDATPSGGDMIESAVEHEGLDSKPHCEDVANNCLVALDNSMLQPREAVFPLPNNAQVLFGPLLSMPMASLRAGCTRSIYIRSEAKCPLYPTASHTSRILSRMSSLDIDATQLSPESTEVEAMSTGLRGANRKYAVEDHTEQRSAGPREERTAELRAVNDGAEALPTGTGTAVVCRSYSERLDLPNPGSRDLMKRDAECSSNSRLVRGHGHCDVACNLGARDAATESVSSTGWEVCHHALQDDMGVDTAASEAPQSRWVSNEAERDTDASLVACFVEAGNFVSPESLAGSRLKYWEPLCTSEWDRPSRDMELDVDMLDVTERSSLYEYRATGKGGFQGTGSDDMHAGQQFVAFLVAAATTIQASFRRHLARRERRCMEIEAAAERLMHRAATTIQSAVRGYQVRRSWGRAWRSQRFESAMAEAVGTAALSQQASQRSRDLRARLQQRRHNLQKICQSIKDQANSAAAAE